MVIMIHANDVIRWTQTPNHKEMGVLQEGGLSASQRRNHGEST